MSPYNYYLCRSDRQTKERHIAKAHSGIKRHVIQFVNANAPTASEALNAYKNTCLKKLDAAQDITKEATNSSAQSENGHFDNSLLNNDQSKSIDETSNSIGGPSHSTAVDEKMDMILSMLKDLSTKIQHGKIKDPPDMSVLLRELKADKGDRVDWTTIDNVVQLTEMVKSIRFFQTDGDKKGCIRCQVCFDYLSSKDNHLKRLDLTRIEEDGGASVASHIKT